MAMVQTTPEPVIDDDVFEEADKFKKRGNWTEERHELNITAEKFDAEIMRLQAAHPERGLTREELDEKYGRIEEEQATARRGELVGA